jgi:putative GTP pyrophosphokinase
MELVNTSLEEKIKETLEMYDKNFFKYNELKEEVVHILDKQLKKENIKIHSITSRIKTKESLAEKIERKQYENPIEEIADIVGVRVVCLFISDIDRIGQCIKTNFEIISEENKINGHDISAFGYMSAHFIAKLKSEYTGPRYDHIKDMKFEIQVRTISMDAWANISHYLDYKSENDIPKELKRDFHALSGLFYVADTHFEMFVKSSEHFRKQTEEAVSDILKNEETHKNVDLNFDSLKTYLIQKFPNRRHSEDKSISALLNELLSVGYTKISEIDEVIKKTEAAFNLYEMKYPPSPGQFADVGVVRVSFRIFDEKYRENIHNRKLVEKSLDPDIQKLVQR